MTYKEENIMFGIESTAYDKKVYAEQLQDFLPDTLVDVHVHLWTPESRKGYVRSDNVVTWPERLLRTALMRI